MGDPVRDNQQCIVTAVRVTGKQLAAMLTIAGKKTRPLSDAATDGDRFGRLIRDGGPDQAQAGA